MKIYVGNLSYRTTDEELREAFEVHGTVGQIDIITDRETGRSKGFGFVEMSNSTEAQDAITALDGKELGERTLRVNEARPRPPRTGGGGGGRSHHGGGGRGDGGGRGGRY
ncbi:MAG: RNA-binding protein [Planctomycetaceae bacterium]|jgi:RNA recognition motif-containing protein|nr:RNA-binding protein [Planctomycetaceae bacterium]